MTKYHVYILKCSDESFYVGMTSNLITRVKQHQTSFFENCYTTHRLPVELVYFEEFSYVLNAIDRERQLKKWSRSKKEALIQKDWNMVSLLGKKKFG